MISSCIKQIYYKNWEDLFQILKNRMDDFSGFKILIK